MIRIYLFPFFCDIYFIRNPGFLKYLVERVQNYDLSCSVRRGDPSRSDPESCRNHGLSREVGFRGRSTLEGDLLRLSSVFFFVRGGCRWTSQDDFAFAFGSGGSPPSCSVAHLRSTALSSRKPLEILAKKNQRSDFLRSSTRCFAEIKKRTRVSLELFLRVFEIFNTKKRYRVRTNK